MVRAPGRAKAATWGVPNVTHRPRRNLPPLPLRMMTRIEWNALPFPQEDPGPRLELPVRHIRYTFTRTPPCMNPKECIPRVQDIQQSFQSQGLPDIMYNFLVGGDGIIYEGRGWDFKCTGEDYFVTSPGPSLNIAYIGTYEDRLVPWQMSHAGEHIRKWALYHHFLTKKHEITPSLACFKEGEEDIDHLAEAVRRLGLDQPSHGIKPEGDKVFVDSGEDNESDKGSDDEGEGSSDVGSEDGSDDAVDDGSDDGSDAKSDDEGSDGGSEDDVDIPSEDEGDDGSDIDTDDESFDDSDAGSDEDDDGESEDDEDDGSDDDDDDGSEDDDGSDDDDGSGDDDGSDDDDGTDDDDDGSDYDSEDEDDDDGGSEDDFDEGSEDNASEEENDNNGEDEEEQNYSD